MRFFWGRWFQVIRSLGLVFLFAGSFTALARDVISFSHWLIPTNDGIRIAYQDPQKLVLSPEIPSSLGTATITFYTAKSWSSSPQQFVEESWRSATAHLSISAPSLEEEIGLLDDVTKGMRRSAQIQSGDEVGLLIVDVYFVGEEALTIITQADNEMVQGVVEGTLTLLHFGLSLNRNQDKTEYAHAEITPKTLPPDPYDSINWEPQAQKLRTSYDLDELNIASVSRQFVQQNRHLVQSAVNRNLAFSEAMAVVEKVIRVEQNKAALEAVRSYLLGQPIEAYLDAAATSVVNGKPENALAILWLANKEYPNHPRLLFNIASLMAQTGEASASNAILAQIPVSDPANDHGFDIGQKDAINYTRAYNAMRLGEVEKAKQLVKPIIAANESFGEASLLLALLNAIDNEDVKNPIMAGIYRRKPAKAVTKTSPKSESPSSSDDDGEEDVQKEQQDDEEMVALNALYVVDLSKGKPGVINAIYQPTSLEDARAFYERFKHQSAQLPRLIEAQDAQIKQLQERWQKSVKSESEREHLMQLDRLFTPANARLPQLKKMLKDRDEGIQDWIDAEDRITTDFGEKMIPLVERSVKDPVGACQAMRNLVSNTHARIRVHTQYMDMTERRVHKLWHQYATALAGLTDNADFRAYLKARINAETEGAYWALVGNTHQSVIYSEHVQECNELALLEEEKKKRAEAELAECDPNFARGVEFSSPMPIGRAKPVNVSAGLEVTCDGFSVELTGELFKTVGVSIETEFKNDGSTTIYVGPKLENPLEGTGPSASGKGGVYVTVDSQGVKDVGLKSVVKVGSKIGVPGVALTSTRTVSEGKISFIASPSVPANAGGLANFGG